MNIYEQIALMRKGMKLTGHTKEEIDRATREVESAKNYEQALQTIKKYWK